jgi:hypothetical protein
MTECGSLPDFVDRHRRLFVLTGAGCSTSSGIPDYRDADGQWKRAQPVTYQAFMGEEKTRLRYWARSLVGRWRIRRARPDDAHRALARLETMGRIGLLPTQNYATYAFSRSPLSRASRSFIGPILKGRKGREARLQVSPREGPESAP